MSPFWFLTWILKMTHTCNHRHRKKGFRKFASFHFSRTAYWNFNLRRLLFLFLSTLEMKISFIAKMWFLRNLKQFFGKKVTFEISNPDSVGVKWWNAIFDEGCASKSTHRQIWLLVHTRTLIEKIKI